MTYMDDRHLISAHCRHCALALSWDGTTWVHAHDSVEACASASESLAEPRDEDGLCASCSDVIVLDEFGLWHHAEDDAVVCGFDPIRWASPKRTDGGKVDWDAAGAVIDQVKRTQSN